MKRPHVVIVGGGFAGLYAAKKLMNTEVDVTVLDRQNYHLFQPLLYEVATAVLSPGDVATPIRHVLAKGKNIKVRMGAAARIELDRKVIILDDGAELPYDYAMLATGVRHSYFGNDTWEAYAPGLKTLDDALEIRRRILAAFEKAEVETDPRVRAAYLTFCIVGGGPTGVELAGAISELARFTVRREFRTFDPREVRTVLIEAGPRILTAFDPDLSAKALKSLERLHVEVMLNTRVEDVGDGGVKLAGNGLFPSRTVMWAAGVATEPFARSAGVPVDSSGRIIVNHDCSLPGHPEVFAVGDLMHFAHGRAEPLPPLAQVAIQSGRHAAAAILGDAKGQPRTAFSYFDKGIMATIGRAAGVVQSGPLKLSGFPGWLGWLFIHLLYLIGFDNQVMVLFQWAQAWVTYSRGVRLITGVTPVPRPGETFGTAAASPAVRHKPAA